MLDHPTSWSESKDTTTNFPIMQNHTICSSASEDDQGNFGRAKCQAPRPYHIVIVRRTDTLARPLGLTATFKGDGRSGLFSASAWGNLVAKFF